MTNPSGSVLSCRPAGHPATAPCAPPSFMPKRSA